MDFSLLGKAKPLLAAHLKKDFGAFCRAAWPTLHPGAMLSWTPGHDLICEWLMLVWRGHTKRLIVNCPPRFAKSSIVTILFPIWVWLQDPKKDFLCCSYEIDLATNHNLDRRRLMDSKWFRGLFADAFTLSTDRSQAQEFSTTAGGTMQAASTNSKAMGRGGDIIVCDDPLSGDVAYSESFRNEVNFWLEHQLPQRLNNPSESAIIVVMQRLHQNDPTGFLLGQEDSEWTLLKLPLIAEQDETITFPVSGRVWKRKRGASLDPKRWSPRSVRERQRNRLVWASQFQQEPMAAEGNIIRTGDILYFGGRDPQTGVADPGLPESFERKIISVDCSFKDLRTSDFVALIVVGVVGSRRYLLHVTNAHLDLTGTENEIRNAHAAFGPISAVLIEDKANGPAIISHLREEISGVVAIDPQGGKMARVVATSPEFQAHNWIIERNGPWTHKVIEQLTMFPNARNDDIVDAISQASIWLQSNSHTYGWLDYLKGLAAGTIKAPEFAKWLPSVEEFLPLKGASVGEPTPSVALTVDQWKKWKEKHQAPPCPHPSCKNACTTLMPDARGCLHIFCRQCGRTDGQDLPGTDKPGHVHKWRSIPGGYERCDDCAEQRAANGAPQVTAVGISRKDYAAGVGRYRGYWRFG